MQHVLSLSAQRPLQYALGRPLHASQLVCISKPAAQLLVLVGSGFCGTYDLCEFGRDEDFCSSSCYIGASTLGRKQQSVWGSVRLLSSWSDMKKHGLMEGDHVKQKQIQQIYIYIYID